MNYHSLTGYFKAGIPKKYRLASNDAIKSTITKSTNMCCKLCLIKLIMLFSCLLGHLVYKKTHHVIFMFIGTPGIQENSSCYFHVYWDTCYTRFRTSLILSNFQILSSIVLFLNQGLFLYQVLYAFSQNLFYQKLSRLFT